MKYGCKDTKKIASCQEFEGDILGNILGDILGNILGNILGDILGDIGAATQRKPISKAKERCEFFT